MAMSNRLAGGGGLVSDAIDEWDGSLAECHGAARVNTSGSAIRRRLDLYCAIKRIFILARGHGGPLAVRRATAHAVINKVIGDL